MDAGLIPGRSYIFTNAGTNTSLCCRGKFLNLCDESAQSPPSTWTVNNYLKVTKRQPANLLLTFYSEVDKAYMSYSVEKEKFRLLCYKDLAPISVFYTDVGAAILAGVESNLVLQPGSPDSKLENDEVILASPGPYSTKTHINPDSQSQWWDYRLVV